MLCVYEQAKEPSKRVKVFFNELELLQMDSVRYVAHAEQAGMRGVRKQPKAVALTLIVFIFSLRCS